MDKSMAEECSSCMKKVEFTSEDERKAAFIEIPGEFMCRECQHLVKKK